MYFDFIVSDERINSKGFIIETSGIQLEEFHNNPVALHNHDINQVIGKWNNVRINDNDEGELIGTVEFDISDKHSQEIMSQVSKDLIKHASIGIKLEEGFMDIVYGKEIIVVTKCTLKEISTTPLPANKGAVKLMYNGEEVEDANEFITLSDNNKFFNNNIKKESNMNSKLIELTNENNDLTNQIKDSNLKFSEIETSNIELNSFIELKDNEIFELNGKVNELNSKLKEIEVAKHKAKFNELLDDAVEVGKINEDQKENFLKLSYDNAKSIVDGLESKVIKPEIKLTDMIDGDKSEEEEDIKTFSWYQENDKKALDLMYYNDRTSYNKLYDAELTK